MEEKQSTDPEKMEVLIRVLGNEIFAFAIVSESKRKNWIIISLISLLFVAMIFDQISPLVMLLMS